MLHSVLLITSFRLTPPSTCIISILRLQSLYVVSVSPDLTWDNPLAAIWSSTETNIGIICSCLPTLKGCVQRFFPRFFPNASSARNISGRETRATGRSQPEWHNTGTSGTAVELEDENKRISKTHTQRISESEESIEHIQPYQVHHAMHDGYRGSNYTWLQDPSTKEEMESRGSDSVRQPSKALSSYHVV